MSMTRIKDIFSSILQQDKAPLVLSLFIGAMAWTITRTIDQLSVIPLLEYQISAEQIDRNQPDMKEIFLQLRNVTHTKQFGCFRVIIVPTPKDAIKFEHDSYQVNLLSNHVPRVFKDKASTGAEQVAVEVNNFGPSADIGIVIRGQGTGDARVYVTECKGEDSTTYGESGKANNKAERPSPILVQRSLRTILVEWELEILWTAIFLWAILLIFLIFNRTAQPKYTKVHLPFRLPAGWGKMRER